MSTIQSIERATLILELISEGKKTKLNDIARHTGLKNSTVHGILTSLLNLGYINMKEGTKEYTLGLRSMLLGVHYKETTGIDNELHNFLTKLMEATMETTYFIVESGGRYYFHDTVHSLQPVSVTPDQNKYSYLPPSAAIPKVYANFQNEGFKYETDFEEVYKGLNCMGIPYILKGRVVGVFAITGPSNRFTKEKMDAAYDAFKSILGNSIF